MYVSQDPPLVFINGWFINIKRKENKKCNYSNWTINYRCYVKHSGILRDGVLPWRYSAVLGRYSRGILDVTMTTWLPPVSVGDVRKMACLCCSWCSGRGGFTCAGQTPRRQPEVTRRARPGRPLSGWWRSAAPCTPRPSWRSRWTETCSSRDTTWRCDSHSAIPGEGRVGWGGNKRGEWQGGGGRGGYKGCGRT